MTNNAELMYDARPPRSRIILGDGSTKKIEFIGKIDLIFPINITEYEAILYNVSFVPSPGILIFSFHVVQEHNQCYTKRRQGKYGPQRCRGCAGEQ